jgi:dephospho-CoA kinase
VSKWPGKYVIGLTGNIATGKSIVRRMLEHLGAYTIDADALSHRAIARGAPGYQPVVEAFGNYTLAATGEIDRTKLGKLAFNNPDVMKELEAIIHPLVESAVDVLIRRASQHVVVIEAIKLLEGKLVPACDAIWVTYAPEELQVDRLVSKRGLSREEALLRIHSQPSQETKIAAANVVIRNTGSFDETWQQVVSAWKANYPAADTTPIITRKPGYGQYSVQRGRPRDSERIAAFIDRFTRSSKPVGPQEVMADFSDKAYLLLMADKDLVGLAAWQVENLVARTTEFLLSPGIPVAAAMKALLGEVERASQDLQCEASLVFLPLDMENLEQTWQEIGYTRHTAQSLGVQAWQEAVLESQPPDTILFFKQLREDRVLRPI